MKYKFCIVLIVALNSAIVAEATAASENNPTLLAHEVMSATVARDIKCSRGLFRYTRTNYAYDLESEFQGRDLSEYRAIARDPRSAASALALLLRIPREQEASVEDDIIDLAFYDHEQNVRRAERRTQLFARYPVDESLLSAYSWPEDVNAVPRRVSIWRDGISHLFTKTSSGGNWISRDNSRGVLLLPRFELFGAMEKYGYDQYLNDDAWAMTVERDDGILRVTWTSSSREGVNWVRGVEVTSEKPFLLKRAWRGMDDGITHESSYSGYINLGNGVYYPKLTRFNVMVPLGDNVVAVSEEVYELLGENILMSCSFDMGVFDPSRYGYYKASQEGEKSVFGHEIDVAVKEFPSDYSFDLPGKFLLELRGSLDMVLPVGWHAAENYEPTQPPQYRHNILIEHKSEPWASTRLVLHPHHQSRLPSLANRPPFVGANGRPRPVLRHEGEHVRATYVSLVDSAHGTPYNAYGEATVGQLYVWFSATYFSEEAWSHILSVIESLRYIPR